VYPCERGNKQTEREKEKAVVPPLSGNEIKKEFTFHQTVNTFYLLVFFGSSVEAIPTMPSSLESAS
jgi:hypothetical protein